MNDNSIGTAIGTTFYAHLHDHKNATDVKKLFAASRKMSYLPFAVNEQPNTSQREVLQSVNRHFVYFALHGCHSIEISERL